MSDKHSKTEAPSSKRISDARKKGQIPRSNELVPAISLLVFAMMAGGLGDYLFRNTFNFLKNSLNTNYSVAINNNYIRTLFINNFLKAASIILPFAAIAMTLGIVINLVQTGFMLTSDPLKPDLKKINPIEGFKNIFSKKVIFNLLKNLLKLSLVFYLAIDNISQFFNQVLNSGNIGTEKLFGFMAGFAKTLIIDIASIMLILAFLDYIFQKREFKKNLMMTKQEVKDEYKEMEGNPQIKSARQQKQRQMAMMRMMSDVPTATVIVTNPTHIAIALRYDTEKDMAPVVVAKGVDAVANRIKEVAKENKVPIIENKPLARAMFKQVEIGDSVPAELYKAVAEIIALVYQLEVKNKGKI